MAPTRTRRLAIATITAVAVLCTLIGSRGPQASPDNPVASRTSDAFPVLVMGERGVLESAVRAVGGSVDLVLQDGSVAATVPSEAVEKLAARPGVSAVLPDGQVQSATKKDDSKGLNAQVWREALNLPQVWHQQVKGKPAVSGAGVTIAVIDTGVDPVNNAAFDPQGLSMRTYDYAGHGTHVSGLAAGDKIQKDNGTGVAPGARVLNVPVVLPRASFLVAAIDWVVANREAYGVRVMNISATVDTGEPYLTSLLNAAVERAWFSGIVVVVAAGNEGPGAINSAPANDPFVITVGAYDDKATLDTGDDSLATWSAYGTTTNGVVKPDVVAPGRHLISNMAKWNPQLAGPSNVMDKQYLSLSGTSMASPLVAGVAALMLQQDPTLNPDQVKARLISTAKPLAGSTAPRVDAYAAVFGTSREEANQGVAINLPLAQAAGLVDGSWTQGNWDAVSWGAVSWGAVSWSAVSWGAVSWGAVSWGSVDWDAVSWGAVSWGAVSWGSIIKEGASPVEWASVD